MNSSRLRMILQSGFFLWAAIILGLSLIPNPPSIDAPLFSWDKFQHAAAFAVLTLLGGAVFQPRFRSGFRGWLISFLFSLAFGVLIEALQATLTVNRCADWKDILADAIGAGFGGLAGLAGQLLRAEERSR